MRLFWLILGLAAVALGTVGIVLPLVPTVPFLLLATFAFARSSERLHHWILSHPRLGPPVVDWNERGVIGTRAKRLATASILAAFAISLLLGVGTRVLAIQAVALGCVALFIWTRPGG